MGLPRVLVREDVRPPESTLHLRATDVAAGWTITSQGGVCRVETALHGADVADAALPAPAESLLLVLMGRADRPAVEIVGDANVADDWLSLPGW